MGYIYKITNKINTKGYIGKTTQPIQKRWDQHIRVANGQDPVFMEAIHYAFLKYGIENFEFEILEEPDNSKLNDREKYWIRYYHTCVYDEQCNGYNLTWGRRRCCNRKWARNI